MGLFDSVRGLFEGDDEPAETESLSATPGERVSPVGREPTPTDFRNKAADAIQEWEVDLDYTYESLPRLDEFADRQGALLDVMADEQDDDERIADIHTGFTIRAGSYFGEVLVRELGGKWVQTDDGWQVAVPEGPEDDDPATVDVFEVAAHSFAKQPVFVEMAEQCGLEPDTDEADEPAAPEPEPQVGAEMEPVAAEFADFWSTYRLDFSLAALARLDDLVTTEWDRGRFADATIGGSDMDSEMLTKLVKQLGAYYGETLVRRLAYNLPEPESNLSTLAAGEAADRLQEAAGLDDDVSVLSAGEGDETISLQQELVERRVGMELWNVFLLAALGFLLAEMVVARRWKPEAASATA